MTGLPYGYQMVSGQIVENPEESRRLRSFFSHYLSGMSIVSAGAIAGIDRTANTLRLMLRNPVYLGTDSCPPLIDADTMNRVKEMLEERAPRNAGRKKKNRVSVKTAFRFRPFWPSPDEDPVSYASILYDCITVSTEAATEA